AWELMTDGYKLDPQRLWITVFEDDEEAAKIWEQEVGVAPARILKRTRAEGNFWDMGVAGPCGPCSELLYDRGPEYGREFTPGDLDEERYLEVWNLVFMQYLQDAQGQIVGSLPNKNVDTGMGLERLAAILQGVSSNFEIDSMAPILKTAEELTGHRYGEAHHTDVGLRVLSEHARSMTFLIADGVLPARTGRGYVLRRLIRRAVRYARLLGVEQQVLSPLTEIAIGIFSAAYPDVRARRDLIHRLVSKEEAAFDDTLRRGLSLLEDEIRKVKAAGSGELPGEVVFKLQDTYGFPQDLTADIATDEELSIDRAGFKALMQQQRDRARAARGVAETGRAEAEALAGLRDAHGKTHFSGYDRLALEAPVLGVMKDMQSVEVLDEGTEGELVLAETPFYPEGGGQVGDTGEISTPSGVFSVESTRWGVPGVVVHQGRVVSGEIVSGEDAAAAVELSHREGVTKAHSATHMLHWELRDVLGEHARQQGSLVEPGRLRFDFAHFEPIDAETLARMEEELNRRVLWDDSVRAFETTFDYATSIGAMALFGEKYGDYVRVVEIGDYSKELCGGTHVVHTGQVGVIKLVHEGSVAAGTRRVEALTGPSGLAYLNSQAERLEKVAQMLKTDPERVVERL
ncbi:MAG: alanine--tRNA ligase, partial [Actinomycetota bacterium]